MNELAQLRQVAAVDEVPVPGAKARARAGLRRHMRPTAAPSDERAGVVVLADLAPEPSGRRRWPVVAGIVAVACAGLVAIGLTTTRVDDPTDVVVRQELPVTTWLAPAEPALLRVGFVPTGYWPAAPPGQIAEFGAERRQQSFLRTDGTGEITGQIIVVRGESDVAAAEAARLSNDYGGRSVRINGTDGFVFEASGDNAIAAWADGSYLFTVSATGLSEADVLRVAESVTVP